ncbi:hypothetical protein [Mucilaginibacter lappiensis]|uniref:hypothetical protein n=1 Tax=Mucilaginibacter lappiensis TaxID=354630 RepID=UPI003D24BFE8
MKSKQNTPDSEWVPVHQEIGGNVVPPENYTGQKLIIMGSTYSILSDNEDEGIIKTNGNKLASPVSGT